MRQIALALKEIVTQLEERCTPRVTVCLVEPRATEGPRWPRMEQETYNKIAKGVNNNIQTKFHKGKGYISFGARPFWSSLARDGVHFDEEGRMKIVEKIKGAILDAFAFQPEAHWGYSDQGRAPAGPSKEAEEEDPTGPLEGAVGGI